jgi:predicted nucleic acid-binding protein
VRTAVDTSVLLAIFKGEADGAAWLEALRRWRAEGALLVCEVVVAELAVRIGDRAELSGALDDLGLVFEPINVASAQAAGQAFAAYRREGGPREHLIPDFLIGAHAQNQADRLAAKDRGYLRRYFQDLPIVAP